jgi:uncharacterized membrane protein
MHSLLALHPDRSFSGTDVILHHNSSNLLLAFLSCILFIWGSPHPWEKFIMRRILPGCLLIALTAGLSVPINFLHAEAGLTLVSPKGGESWSAGSLHFFVWKAGLFPAKARLRIEFSTDGGKKWTTIAGEAPNSGKYLWKIPGAVS